MSLEDEFHKSLLDESKVYREKVSTIWLQEFTILGAIIAFAATKVEASSKNPEYLVASLAGLMR